MMTCYQTYSMGILNGRCEYFCILKFPVSDDFPYFPDSF
jgi:hypothetical protein